MTDYNKDTDLWNSFISGNESSFDQLFRKFYPLLLNYGKKIHPEVTLVEDCIHELFIDLWQKRPSVPIVSVKAYLIQAVKFKIYKVLSRNKPLAFTEEELQTNFDISYENFLIEQEDQKQKGQLIIEALQSLPARQKEIIYLKIYQNLSYEEICAVMNINYQVARNLFCLAMKSFRNAFIKK